MPAKPDDPKLEVDPNKPLMIFNFPNGKTFREGEEVVIDFSLANAQTERRRRRLSRALHC